MGKKMEHMFVLTNNEEDLLEEDIVDDKLLENSTTTKRADYIREHGGNPPRPLNCYMIFSRSESAKPKYKNMQAKKKSKEIGKLWKKLPKKRKNHYKILAEKAKKMHNKLYPGYKFKKKNKNEKKSPKEKAVNRNELEANFLPVPAPSPSPATASSSGLLTLPLTPEELNSFLLRLCVQHNSLPTSVLSPSPLVPEELFLDSIPLHYTQYGYSPTLPSPQPPPSEFEGPYTSEEHKQYMDTEYQLSSSSYSPSMAPVWSENHNFPTTTTLLETDVGSNFSVSSNNANLCTLFNFIANEPLEDIDSVIPFLLPKTY